MTNHLSIAHPKSFEVKGCQEDYHDKGFVTAPSHRYSEQRDSLQYLTLKKTLGLVVNVDLG